jgi:hypothetical protein
VNPLLWIDGLFAELCGSLSGPLKDEARRLPFTLGLAPEPFTPWSHVFSQEITLAAPVMVAEAMPELPGEVVREALFAHALAVIHAMGTDRIEDGQVEPTPTLRKVLAAARVRRNELLARVAAGRDMPLDPDTADRELLDAVRQERELLLGRRRVDFAMYEALSRRKQSAAMLGSAALAARAGWAPPRSAALRRVLLGAAMGLQLYDDVIDWEDDAAAGRSWAVSLARGRLQSSRSGASAGDAVVEQRAAELHAAGVLPEMLGRARFHFHATARLAKVLGALRLALWARERATSLRELAEREGRSAGYVSRARKLAPWARAVLDPRA